MRKKFIESIRKHRKEEILDYFAENVRYRIHKHKKGKGEVFKYIFQLEFFYRGEWRVVLRYNNFHNFFHKDIFNPQGDKIARTELGNIGIRRAMLLAVRDIKENYKTYIKDFQNLGEADEEST